MVGHRLHKWEQFEQVGNDILLIQVKQQALVSLTDDCIQIIDME